MKSISTLHAANSTKFTGWWQKHGVTLDEWVDYDDLAEDGSDEDDFVVGDQEEFEDDDDDDEEEDQYEEVEERRKRRKRRRRTKTRTRMTAAIGRQSATYSSYNCYF